MKVPLIAIEGIDGAGKTTVSDALAAGFEGLLVTGELRSGLGPLLRERLADLTPYEKVYWFAADRASGLVDAQRRINEGDVRAVVWDRYVDSARVYRRAEVELGIATPDILELVETINGDFSDPDLVLYLDVEVAVAEQRLQERRGRPDPRLPLALDEYRRLATTNATYVTIDAASDQTVVIAAAIEGVERFLN